MVWPPSAVMTSRSGSASGVASWKPRATRKAGKSICRTNRSIQRSRSASCDSGEPGSLAIALPALGHDLERLFVLVLLGDPNTNGARFGQQGSQGERPGGGREGHRLDEPPNLDLDAPGQK